MSKTRGRSGRWHFHEIVIDSAASLDWIRRDDDALFNNPTSFDILTRLVIEAGANRLC